MANNKMVKVDIFKMLEVFGIKEDKTIWDLMRKGVRLIDGKKFQFIKIDEHESLSLRSHPKSYQKDFGHAIIGILNIVTHDKKEYSYHFYQKFFDENPNIQLSMRIQNSILWYKYSTGESPPVTTLMGAFSNNEFKTLQWKQ